VRSSFVRMTPHYGPKPLCSASGLRIDGGLETTETSLVIRQDVGQTVEIRLDAAHDTVWLTQRQMADRFKTSTDNVSLLLKNTDATGERGEGATTEDSLSVRLEGKRCQVFPQ
jgi:hypothetical protein